MCLLLIAAAAAETYVFDKNNRYFASSPHMISVSTAEKQFGDYADLFRLIKTYDDGTTVIQPAYCADLGQPLKDTNYGRLDLQDSYMKEKAGKIRSILDKGYWPWRDVADLAQRAGVTEGTLTEAEALTATQAAIWSYTDGASKADAAAMNSDRWVVGDEIYLCTISRKNTVLYTGVNQKELGFDDYAYYWNNEAVQPSRRRIKQVYHYLMSLPAMEEEEDVTWTFEGEYIILSEIWQKDNADGSNDRPNVNSGWWDAFWDWWLGMGGKPQGEGQYYYRIMTRFKLDGTEEGLDDLALTATLVIDGKKIESQTFNMMDKADVALLKQDKEGYYSVGFSYPLTSAEFDKDAKIVLSLSGRQTMSEVPYLYLCTDEEGRTYSQTLVGVEDRIVTLADEATLKVEDAKLSLQGQKYRHGQPTGTAYSFDLFESDASGAQGKLIQTVSNDEKGGFSFADISYTDKTTRYYRVSEHLPEGLTDAQKADYDQGWYHIKVEVTGNDALVVTPTITHHPASGKAGAAVVQGLIFDNKPTTTFTVEKKWNHLAADNALVPASIGVTLYENGEPHGEVFLSADNQWRHTWYGLNADSSWTVAETTGSDDFISTVRTVEGGAEIVNTSRLGTLRVEKVWDLMPYQAQPEEVVVILLKDGVEARRATLPNENGEWWCQWNDLDRDAVWTVTEATPAGMKMEIAPAEDGADNGRDQAFVITNSTEIQYADYTVQKVWNLNPYQSVPESVSVALYYSVGADGEKTQHGEVVVLSEANGWAHTWEQLDSGYTWTVAETDLPEDMQSAIAFDGETHTFTLTNSTVVQLTKVSVVKRWEVRGHNERIRPVQVALFCALGDETPRQYGEAVLLSAENDWAHTWTELDAAYTWTVQEVSVPAQMTAQTEYDAQQDCFIITNCLDPEPVTDVSVRKVWEVRENRIPASVEVGLYRNGQLYDTATLSVANDWQTVWHGLPAAYVWTVAEMNVPAGMISTVAQNGCDFVITNTMEVDVPATGDSTMPLLWLTLCVLCGASLMVLRRRAWS